MYVNMDTSEWTLACEGDGIVVYRLNTDDSPIILMKSIA